MTDMFRMDDPQPRLLDETGQGIVGAPLDRPDGPLKTTGRAPYAAEVDAENLATGYLVRATIAKGRLVTIDESALKNIPGVIGVWRSDAFLRNPAQGMAGAAPEQPGVRIDFHGQPIALVVAESFEAAREAAQALTMQYETDKAVTDPETASTVEEDASSTDTIGDLDAAMRDAAFTVDRTYTTPGHAAAAMEPHAAMAHWDGGTLTLHGALQMLRFNRSELADALGLEEENVRILSPYIGGGFGSKLGVSPEVVAAAVAARELDRPVRVVMARQQVFDTILRRTETRQRLRLAADKDGRLTGVGHEDRISTLDGESFTEPTAWATQFLYGGANRTFRKEIARINRVASGSVRAPGEAVGMLALENAMDELAETSGLDPIELRLRNIPERHPMKDIPYSARHLGECLQDGAEAFGWSKRQRPRERREGDWFIGMGVASAARANMTVPAAARIRLSPEGAIVETDMTDIGTGSYAIFTQIAAEMLGLPMDKVTTKLGDTRFPGGSGSGGSVGAGSTGSAVFLAAKKLRAQLGEKMSCSADEITLADGMARCGNRERPIADLCGEELVAEAGIQPGALDESVMQAAFGAHFAEVAVHAFTGEVRARRMLGVFAAGRILNEKTARSQCFGGMVWGLGSALMEELAHDPRTGQIANRDLANYHIAASADVPKMDVRFVEERDDHTNPMQSKGIGELGISGAGAAIVNAIYNACGVRLYDYPATPDKIIAGLEAQGL